MIITLTDKQLFLVFKSLSICSRVHITKNKNEYEKLIIEIEEQVGFK